MGAEAEARLPEHPRSGRARALCAALFGLYFLWNGLDFWPYLIDDTFISLRYAANLVEGHGLVFNPGERVEGYSNFSWVLLGAAALALGLPPVTTLKCLGLASGLGVVVGTAALARRLFVDSERAALRVTLATAFVGLHASLAVWSQAGLETVFFALLLVLTALRFERELADDRARPLSALLFALAWMTRPEAPAYLLYLVLRRLAARSSRPLGRRDLAWWLAFGLLVLPYEVFGLLYYGQLLPMTHQAKVGPLEFGDPDRAASLRALLAPPLVRQFWTQQGLGFQAMVVAGLGGCLLGRKRLPLAAVLVPIAGLVFVLYARTDWMPRHRFFVPVLAFLGLALGFGLGELVARAARVRLLHAAAWLFVLLSVGDYARVQVLGGQGPRATAEEGIATRRRGPWFAQVPGRFGERVYPMEMEALTILTQLPPGAVIAMRDIGFVGFLTMNPVWDTAGLFTPVVARARHDESPEATERMLAELRAVEPRCLYLVLTDNEHLSIDDRIDEWLRTDPQAGADYRVTLRRATPRAGETTVLWIRTDAASPPGPERVDARLARWPEYETRARELIARWRAGDGG